MNPRSIYIYILLYKKFIYMYICVANITVPFNAVITIKVSSLMRQFWKRQNKVIVKCIELMIIIVLILFIVCTPSMISLSLPLH